MTEAFNHLNKVKGRESQLAQIPCGSGGGTEEKALQHCKQKLGRAGYRGECLALPACRTRHHRKQAQDLPA